MEARVEKRKPDYNGDEIGKNKKILENIKANIRKNDLSSTFFGIVLANYVVRALKRVVRAQESFEYCFCYIRCVK